jgi:dihydrofolate reductase
LGIARSNGEKEAFVIGGSEIYELAMPVANKLYLTEINATIEGDTYFPEFNKQEWKEAERRHHPEDADHQYSFDFVVYEKQAAVKKQ